MRRHVDQPLVNRVFMHRRFIEDKWNAKTGFLRRTQYTETDVTDPQWTRDTGFKSNTSMQVVTEERSLERSNASIMHIVNHNGRPEQYVLAQLSSKQAYNLYPKLLVADDGIVAARVPNAAIFASLALALTGLEEYKSDLGDMSMSLTISVDNHFHGDLLSDIGTAPYQFRFVGAGEHPIYARFIGGALHLSYNPYSGRGLKTANINLGTSFKFVGFSLTDTNSASSDRDSRTLNISYARPGHDIGSKEPTGKKSGHIHVSESVSTRSGDAGRWTNFSDITNRFYASAFSLIRNGEPQDSVPR